MQIGNAWAVAVGLAIALPWTTPLLGWAPDHGTAAKMTPLILFLAGGLAVVCCWVAETDLWLGVFGLWVVLRAAVTLGPPLVDASAFTVAGIAILAAAQRIPAEWYPRVRTALWVSGALQALYAITQYVGYHPLATGLMRISWAPDGTMGNRGLLGAYLSITVAFAPGWLLWLWAIGLVLSQSVIALAAAAVALAIRYRWGAARCAPYGLVALGLALAAGLGLVAMTRGDFVASSAALRLEGYRMALQSMHGWPVLVGYGPGSWEILAVPLTNAVGTAGPGYEIPLHCDPLQAWFEYGLIGVACIVAWLVSHWTGDGGRVGPRSSVSPALAACAAIGIQSCGHFPFHLGTIGALACVVIGLATAAGEQAPPRTAERSGGNGGTR